MSASKGIVTPARKASIAAAGDRRTGFPAWRKSTRLVLALFLLDPAAGLAQATVPPPAKVESEPLPPPPGAAKPDQPAALPSTPGTPTAPASAAPGSVAPAGGSPAAAGSAVAPSTPVPPAISQVPPQAAPPPVPQASTTPNVVNPPIQTPPAPNPVPTDPALAPSLPPPAALPTPGIPQPGGQLPSSASIVPRDFGSEPDLTELVIEPRSVLILDGDSSNDEAFANLQNALVRLTEEARKAGIVITGRPFAVIDLTDEKRFRFQAMLPVENTAQTPPVPGLRFGQSPSGPAIRFKYQGAYEDDSYVYESIEAYLEERDIKAKPFSIEEFLTDPKDSADASLQMFIYYLKE